MYKYNQLCYEYPLSRLWSGGSYGNPDCFARTDRASNLSGFWLASTNEWVCGRLDLRMEIDGVLIQALGTSFYPGHQQTSFNTGNTGGMSANKVVLVPYGTAPGGGSSFYTVLQLQASAPVHVRVVCDVRWPAVQTRDHTKQPERFHVQRRLAIAPNLPKQWRWLSMRNLPYRGERISFFWHQGTLHTTHAVSSPLPQVVYDRDVSEEVAIDLDDGLAVTALERDEGVTFLVAATRAFEGVVRFSGQEQNMCLSAGEAALVSLKRGT